MAEPVGARAPRLALPRLAMAPRHVAVALAVAAVWGFNFIAAKAALGQIPPLLLTALRFAVVAAVLVPFAPRPERLLPVFVVSVCLGVVHFALMFWAMALTTRIAPIAVAVQLSVPFGALLAAFLLNDRLGRRRLLGMALALAGVVLMTFDPVVLAELDALGLAVASAFLWALGSVLSKRLRVADAFTLNAYMALLATPQLLVLSLLFERDHVAVLTGADLAAWAAVLYMALAVTVFGYGVWFSLLRRYPVNLVMPFQLTVPPFAALFSMLVLGEVLTWQVAAGGLVTIVGVGVVLLRRPELGRAQV
ncbi:MAG TPA: EamA family transporter [Geminicoccaceae bacterium]|nr:EamA family transporter [Geminicoccaceae bacterium]